jgi:hypothetical protein
MKKYDYYLEVKKDIIDYITLNDIEVTETDGEELYDMLWAVDEVTGNGAAGGYYSRTEDAENALAHNWDLIKEAFYDLGVEESVYQVLDKGPIWVDVIVRLYVLYQAIEDALFELRE